MKKSSFLIIFAIFVLPLALYYFIKTPSESNVSFAKANVAMAKVIQFTSPMCYDCSKIEKELKPLREEYKSKIMFEKIDVSSRTPVVNSLIEKYDVNVVPTLIFLDKNGQLRRKTEGYVPKHELQKYLNEISYGQS